MKIDQFTCTVIYGITRAGTGSGLHTATDLTTGFETEVFTGVVARQATGITTVYEIEDSITGALKGVL